MRSRCTSSWKVRSASRRKMRSAASSSQAPDVTTGHATSAPQRAGHLSSRLRSGPGRSPGIRKPALRRRRGAPPSRTKKSGDERSGPSALERISVGFAESALRMRAAERKVVLMRVEWAGAVRVRPNRDEYLDAPINHEMPTVGATPAALQVQRLIFIRA